MASQAASLTLTQAYMAHFKILFARRGDPAVDGRALEMKIKREVTGVPEKREWNLANLYRGQIFTQRIFDAYIRAVNGLKGRELVSEYFEKCRKAKQADGSVQSGHFDRLLEIIYSCDAPNLKLEGLDVLFKVENVFETRPLFKHSCPDFIYQIIWSNASALLGVADSITVPLLRSNYHGLKLKWIPLQAVTLALVLMTIVRKGSQKWPKTDMEPLEFMLKEVLYSFPIIWEYDIVVAPALAYMVTLGFTTSNERLSALALPMIQKMLLVRKIQKTFVRTLMIERNFSKFNFQESYIEGLYTEYPLRKGDPFINLAAVDLTKYFSKVLRCEQLGLFPESFDPSNLKMPNYWDRLCSSVRVVLDSIGRAKPTDLDLRKGGALYRARHLWCGNRDCNMKPARKKCGQCQVIRYCSRECQVADWPRHKELCPEFSASPPSESIARMWTFLPWKNDDRGFEEWGWVLEDVSNVEWGLRYSANDPLASTP